MFLRITDLKIGTTSEGVTTYTTPTGLASADLSYCFKPSRIGWDKKKMGTPAATTFYTNLGIDNVEFSAPELSYKKGDIIDLQLVGGTEDAPMTMTGNFIVVNVVYTDDLVKVTVMPNGDITEVGYVAPAEDVE